MLAPTMVVAEPEAVQRWRVIVSNRADCAFALRDYFRRLGLDSSVEGPTAVSVSGTLAAEELAEFMESWSTVNRVALVLQPAVGPAPRPSLPHVPAISTGGAPPPRLGELLISKGYINEAQLGVALVKARVTKSLLGVVLLNEKLIFEDELARTLSEQLALPYVSIMRIGINRKAADLLPQRVGEAVAAIPVRERRHSVQVAFADPTDIEAVSEVRRYIPTVEPAVAELSDILLAWRSFAGISSYAQT